MQTSTVADHAAMPSNSILLVGSQITVTVGARDAENPGLGYEYKGCRIDSTLERELCTRCGQPDCCYTCDRSAANTQDVTSDLRRAARDEVVARLKFNGAMDGIESLILACAAAGIDVESPDFLEAVETAIEAANNKL